MKKCDILIYFSDQHNYQYSGFSGNKIVLTPNLDNLARDGTTFKNTYTSCPLCVPARTSFVTGQYASKTGVFTNDGTFSSDQATFLHSVAAIGYETVLCGRIHFVGEDQRHGFTKRIMYDMGQEGLGPYYGTRGHLCTKVVGGGNSPVLAYDRSVISAISQYLNLDHDKPQCIVVGTYAPHFPYVAPEELYKYYNDIADLPQSRLVDSNYEDCPMVTVKKEFVQVERLKKIRAAYYGMITFMDEQIGLVRDAWDNYLKRNQREGVFVYISDHGDTAGEHGLHGKTTFYDGSAKIPLIFEGCGVKKGVSINSAASIVDISPTICEMIGAEAPGAQDGKSLLTQIKIGINDEGRHVISEFVEQGKDGNVYPGVMVKKDRWKFIRYYMHEQFDMLFDTEEDPYEMNNIINKLPELQNDMSKILDDEWEIDSIISRYKVNSYNHNIIRKWKNACNVKEKEYRSVMTEEAKLPRLY